MGQKEIYWLRIRSFIQEIDGGSLEDRVDIGGGNMLPSFFIYLHFVNFADLDTFAFPLSRSDGRGKFEPSTGFYGTVKAVLSSPTPLLVSGF